MKKLAYFVVGFIVFAVSESSWAQEDISAHPNCTYCGMDRAKFAHSRVFIEYEDGSTFGACSLHCAAIDMAVNIHKAPKSILVADYSNKKLIDAESAIWVIGGNQAGVMTARAKWAFEYLADANSFIKNHGGDLASFERAIKTSYEDMYHDTRMIHEKHKMKRMEKKNEKD
jgi:copper chaperone NosL